MRSARDARRVASLTCSADEPFVSVTSTGNCAGSWPTSAATVSTCEHAPWRPTRNTRQVCSPGGSASRGVSKASLNAMVLSSHSNSISSRPTAASVDRCSAAGQSHIGMRTRTVSVESARGLASTEGASGLLPLGANQARARSRRCERTPRRTRTPSRRLSRSELPFPALNSERNRPRSSSTQRSSQRLAAPQRAETTCSRVVRVHELMPLADSPPALARATNVELRHRERRCRGVESCTSM